MPVQPNRFSVMEHWADFDPEATLYVRLYKLQMPVNVPHLLGDFNEADYPGYEEEELIPDRAQTFEQDVYGVLTSEMLTFVFAEGMDGENLLGGFLIVAVYPDGYEELVVWENFRSNIIFNAEAGPFGLVIDLFSNYFFLAA